MRAMYDNKVVPAWLIVDARTLTKYGLGMITMPYLPKFLLKKYIDSGYLHSGKLSKHWPRISASTRKACTRK